MLDHVQNGRRDAGHGRKFVQISDQAAVVFTVVHDFRGEVVQQLIRHRYARGLQRLTEFVGQRIRITAVDVVFAAGLSAKCRHQSSDNGLVHGLESLVVLDIGTDDVFRFPGEFLDLQCRYLA